MWSLDRKTHLGYADELFLKDCKFIVNETQRKKVLSSGKRFPHAFVIGEKSRQPRTFLKNQVSYNPFKNSHFMNGKRKVLTSSIIHLTSSGKVLKP